MVLESFSAFEPRVGELAQRVFDQDHLDSEVRKGKQGGAFCASINPETTPYVLMNYTGRARDVATLAHHALEIDIDDGDAAEIALGVHVPRSAHVGAGDDRRPARAGA